jgi:hypothetical protein
MLLMPATALTEATAAMRATGRQHPVPASQKTTRH